MSTQGAVGQQLFELRREFDAAFTRAFVDPLPTRDFISIFLGEDEYAVALEEIERLETGIAVAPMPSPSRDLMGLAQNGGDLAPVYDLSTLLGHRPTSGAKLALARGARAFFAFDGLGKHLRIGVDSIVHDANASSGRLLQSTAHVGAQVIPIVDLTGLVAILTERAARIYATGNDSHV